MFPLLALSEKTLHKCIYCVVRPNASSIKIIIKKKNPPNQRVAQLQKKTNLSVYNPKCEVPLLDNMSWSQSWFQSFSKLFVWPKNVL